MPLTQLALCERRSAAWRFFNCAPHTCGVYLSSRGFIPVTFADVILGFRLARNAGPGDAPAR